MPNAVRTGVLIVAVLAAAGPAATRGQDLPTQLKPLTSEAIAESLAVIRQIDSALKRRTTDGDLWYRRGQISWVLAEQARRGVTVPGFERIELSRMADTSLRLAVEYAPTNPRYLLTMGQLMLGPGFLSLSRWTAYRYFDRALDVGRKSDNPALHAEAALEVGRVSWRRYDALAHRRMETSPDVVLSSLTAATGASSGTAYIPPDQIRRHLDETTIAMPNQFSGESNYLQAEELFREAYAAAPGETRTFRHVAMVLAERDRWSELADFSRRHLKAVPRDPWAWMSLGLALRRQGQLLPVEAAFDSAMARFDPDERARLDRIERVIAPRDTSRFAEMSEAERERAKRSYWQNTDPLWATDGNDSHTEFLARVTYAELRWTVEEFGVRGVDSDRGNVHVRYGPPQVRMQIGPNPSTDRDMSREGSTRGSVARSVEDNEDPDFALIATGVTTIWAYDNGLLFFFRGQPTYGTSYIPGADAARIAEALDTLPARWNNVSGMDVRDMPAHIARFRWTGDSVALVIAVDPPIDAMQQAATVNAPVRVDLWFGGDTTVGVARDSIVLRTQRPQSWTYSVGPGRYGYRIEATSDAVAMAGRTGGSLLAGDDPSTGFTHSGFGMSDLLLAGPEVPRPVGARWYDLRVTPTGPTIPRDGELTLVWENYEFGERDGAASYDLAITLQREFSTVLNRVRARVIAGVAELLGVERTPGRVIYRYSRTVPHAPTLVEYIGLSMPDTPPGEYTLTVHVRDNVSGRSTQRTARIIIRE